MFCMQIALAPLTGLDWALSPPPTHMRLHDVGSHGDGK